MNDRQRRSSPHAPPTPTEVTMRRLGLTRVALHRQTGIADSTIYHAVKGSPVHPATAGRLYACFVEAGYQGTIEQLFVIGNPGVRNDLLSERARAHTPVQRRRQ